MAAVRPAWAELLRQLRAEGGAGRQRVGRRREVARGMVALPVGSAAGGSGDGGWHLRR